MKKSIYILTIAICVFIWNTSCKKLITVPLPNNKLVSSTVFLDSATSQSAVYGLYSKFYNGFVGGIGYYSYNITLHPARLADEMYPVSSTADNFYSNSLVSTNGDVEGLWNDSYSCIYIANSIIQGAQNSPAISAGLKQQLIAEAKFVRALCYFYLVNYYGPVPLVTTTDVSISSKIPRTSVAQVYDQLVADLSEAENSLSADYSWSHGTRTRANKWAASAMLSRVYLYIGKWPEAEAAATKVISQEGLYRVVKDDLANVFLSESKETILAFYNGGNGFPYQSLYTQLRPNTLPNFALNSALLNAFEKDDIRPSKWISSISYDGNNYSYPSKYKSSGNNEEYQVFLRISELLLIRSEARAYQNNFLGAKSDIDQIRSKAGLGGTSANDLPSFKIALEHERQTELFLEWGDRWLNLKRTGRADAVLKPIKGSIWQSTDVLYPIPLQSISTNPTLIQNPGYN
ncbi:RagB/SusD family nutrient uptake outer membrane protein [Pedobacter psychroterrae]|uniref:RagB/SusD family nutrient uptake outer membrane protein n=1 Tax=Pedobacter psychroterrae TaxID=2530453 RepID=A0A4R0NUI6_9SPHI|nr:RagB/SusD family nutrient uptake outer membrane protein [Pedobacter psychroterrae]TCD03145.1 RagB/SusD family nutrient uptake outer membrane protein [Pedobacter psychroterrae]